MIGLCIFLDRHTQIIKEAWPHYLPLISIESMAIRILFGAGVVKMIKCISVYNSTIWRLFRPLTTIHRSFTKPDTRRCLTKRPDRIQTENEYSMKAMRGPKLTDSLILNMKDSSWNSNLFILTLLWAFSNRLKGHTITTWLGFKLLL